MTPESDDVAPLDPDDELGNIEADLPPEGDVEPDPYIEDENYDPDLAQIDPETRGTLLPAPEGEE